MFLRSIYIVGAQSTGKTTLANALHKRFTTPSDLVGVPTTVTDVNDGEYGISNHALISEVARTVVTQTNIGRSEIRNSQQRCLELQELILDAQYQAESTAGTYFISDRSGIDPLAYASFHAPCDQIQRLLKKREWQVLRDRLQNSLVIIIEPSAELLEDDGTRLLPLDAEEWWKFHLHFCNLMESFDIAFHVLKGSTLLDLSERVEYVMKLYNSGPTTQNQL